MTIRVLHPEKGTIAKDLRRLADKIENGEVPATTGILTLSDRESATIRVFYVGEMNSYSNGMGLLAYASAYMYQQAQGK